MLRPYCNAMIALALSSARLGSSTKLVSLKERNELTQGKRSQIKRYLFADKVVLYHFWTGIASLRTLRSAETLR